MGSMNSEGSVYFHVISVTFGLIIFAALKNADFNDITDSGDLSPGQVSFIVYATVLGTLLALVFLGIRAQLTRVGSSKANAFGLFFIFLGVAGIVSALGIDAFLGDDVSVDSDGMLTIVLSSLLPMAGAYMVAASRFSTTRLDESLAMLVREEISRAVASNNVICPSCEKVINAYSRTCKHCGFDFTADEEETEDVLVAVGPPEPPGSGAWPAPRPSPAAQGAAMFTCSNPACGKKLKISNPKRPLTVKCPACGTTETLGA